MKKIFISVTIIVLGIVFYFFPNISNISAGLAILLFGMMFLEDGFKLLTGGPIEKWLKKSTNNVAKSISFGIVSTSILQSSALVTVVSISFLSSGMIDLFSGIGIVFGANIGTTSGAWLISLFGLKMKISAFALPLLVFGIILVLQNEDRLKGSGYVLAGIGFLFLGIHFMKEGFETYQQTFDLKSYSLPGFLGLVVYTFVGILATIVMQSSHASLAIILAALSTNQISYENGLAMAIGANIGTTVTAIIGAISSNTQGKRLAGAHLVFNSVTAILALIFIKQFSFAVDYLSNHLGISATDYTLKLSMFHTLFNVVGVIVMLPLIPWMIKLLQKVFKQKVSEDIAIPIYLSKASLKYKETAIPALIKESRHLFDNAFEIIAHGINLHRVDILSDKKLKEIVPVSTDNMKINIDDIYQRKIKLIYSKIVKYATIVQSYKISENEAVLVNKVRVANRYTIEIIKHLRNLQHNIFVYAVSENEFIRGEYNLLRLKIAKVMREIYKTEHVDNLNQQTEKLLKLQRKAKLHDVLVNGKLDLLIREKKINSKMATSLMNDSAMVALICERLITIAELIFIESDRILETYDFEETDKNGDFFEEAAF